MKVIPLTKSNEQLWDPFVERHPQTNMYHLLGWKRVFESVFGYKPYYLMAVDADDAVRGILPMFLMTDIFRRKYLVSNPFSNFAGVCADNAEAEKLLVARACELAAEANARYVEFRQLDHKLNSGLPAKESFVTLFLKLQKDPDAIWNSLASRNRGKVRKAEKNGVEAALGTEFLSAFYDIYAENLRYLGTPVFPFRMFRKITEVFSDRIELLTITLDGRPISGMYLFKFKQVISEPWVASLRQYNRIYVNNYLYWQAIKYACENGFEIFDFGRSTVDTGTYQFKLQWGAEPVQLYYHYFLNRATEIPVVDARDNKYQKVIDIWKRLPLAFTNFAGPRLVQYLPEL